MLSPGPSPYKPTHPADSRFALPGWSVLDVAGADAAAFLQAQTMNDVRALQPRHWQWNGWLSPKGRLHALFAVLRTGESAFALLVPDMPAMELGDALRRYVFRSKVKLDADAGWHVQGEFAAMAQSDPADLALHAAPDAWVLDMGSAALGRRLHLSRDGDIGATAALTAAAGGGTAGPDSTRADAWFEFDLRHGLPRLPASQREAWTPQMLSLQRLRAYSVSKGCYPGHEIVARTHFLGQAKRRLHLLSGEALAIGGDVRADSGVALGSIVCVHPDGRLALAVLGEFDHAAPLQSAGNPARALPLEDGLQRPL
jgi:folate-binding protein YgfZ